MSQSTFGGGTQVKASTLAIGDTIRSTKKIDRIMIVESVGNQIFVRGYEQNQTNHHEFLYPDQIVIKVTNTSTETTKDGIA